MSDAGSGWAKGKIFDGSEMHQTLEKLRDGQDVSDVRTQVFTKLKEGGFIKIVYELTDAGKAAADSPTPVKKRRSRTPEDFGITRAWANR